MTDRRLGLVALLVCGLVLGLVGCGSAQPTSRAPSRPSGAATSTAPGPGNHRLTMTWAGAVRAYTVHAPPGYTPTRRLPTVLVMHDRGSSSDVMQQMTGLDAVADRAGFLVVYLNGVNGAFNALICCGDVDDVGYVRTLVPLLVRDWHADPDRLYLAGISNGGDMSFKLAVELPGVFAAIAPVSGGFIGERATSDAAFVAKTPVSVISFIGAQDPYASDFTAGIATWRHRLHCAQPRTQSMAGGQVTRTSTHCPDGSDVVTYTLKDMSHAWPGGAAVGLGDPATPIKATDLMWQFFAAHKR